MGGVIVKIGHQSVSAKNALMSRKGVFFKNEALV
jgi:hypothetical protein